MAPPPSSMPSWASPPPWHAACSACHARSASYPMPGNRPDKAAATKARSRASICGPMKGHSRGLCPEFLAGQRQSLWDTGRWVACGWACCREPHCDAVLGIDAMKRVERKPCAGHPLVIAISGPLAAYSPATATGWLQSAQADIAVSPPCMDALAGPMRLA